MRPQLKPLFGSDGRNGAGRGNERVYFFFAAFLAYFGLRQLRVGRWTNGIMQIGLALMWFYISWRERTRRS